MAQEEALKRIELQVLELLKIRKLLYNALPNTSKNIFQGHQWLQEVIKQSDLRSDSIPDLKAGNLMYFQAPTRNINEKQIQEVVLWLKTHHCGLMMSREKIANLLLNSCPVINQAFEVHERTTLQPLVEEIVDTLIHKGFVEKMSGSKYLIKN